mgnify:FL=1
MSKAELEAYHQGRMKTIRRDIMKLSCKYPHSNNKIHVAVYEALMEVEKILDNNN